MKNFHQTPGTARGELPEGGRISRISDCAKARYIDLKSDFGFKKIFGKAVNKDFLIHFLNTLIEGKHIQDLIYMHSEMMGLSVDSRDVVFDVQCTAEDGSVFIVEMQKKNQKTFRERTLFYSTFAIQEQMKKGNSEYRIPPIYVICILDFKLEHPERTISENNAYLVSTYSLRNDKIHEDVMTDSLHFVYLELARFRLGEAELKTDLDKWCFALKGMQDLLDRPVAFQKEIFRRLFAVAEVEGLPMGERIQYEMNMTTERDLRNQMAYAKEIATKEGRAEGFAQGLTEGRAEGRAEGVKTGVLQTARAMLAHGVDKATVAACTGLSSEEVESL